MPNSTTNDSNTLNTQESISQQENYNQIVQIQLQLQAMLLKDNSSHLQELIISAEQEIQDLLNQKQTKQEQIEHQKNKVQQLVISSFKEQSDIFMQRIIFLEAIPKYFYDKDLQSLAHLELKRAEAVICKKEQINDEIIEKQKEEFGKILTILQKKIKNTSAQIINSMRNAPMQILLNELLNKEQHRTIYKLLLQQHISSQEYLSETLQDNKNLLKTIHKNIKSAFLEIQSIAYNIPEVFVSQKITNTLYECEIETNALLQTQSISLKQYQKISEKYIQLLKFLYQELQTKAFFLQSSLDQLFDQEKCKHLLELTNQVQETTNTITAYKTKANAEINFAVQQKAHDLVIDQMKPLIKNSIASMYANLEKINLTQLPQELIYLIQEEQCKLTSLNNANYISIKDLAQCWKIYKQILDNIELFYKKQDPGLLTYPGHSQPKEKKQSATILQHANQEKIRQLQTIFDNIQSTLLTPEIKELFLEYEYSERNMQKIEYYKHKIEASNSQMLNENPQAPDDEALKHSKDILQAYAQIFSTSHTLIRNFLNELHTKLLQTRRFTKDINLLTLIHNEMYNIICLKNKDISEITGDEIKSHHQQYQKIIEQIQPDIKTILKNIEQCLYKIASPLPSQKAIPLIEKTQNTIQLLKSKSYITIAEITQQEKAYENITEQIKQELNLQCEQILNLLQPMQNSPQQNSPHINTYEKLLKEYLITQELQTPTTETIINHYTYILESAQNEAVIEILQMQEILQNIPQSFLSQGSRKAIKNLQEELTAHKETIHAISKNAGATSENYPTETSNEKTITALEKYKILSEQYESVFLSINLELQQSAQNEAVIEISQMQEILQNTPQSFLSQGSRKAIKNLQEELTAHKETIHAISKNTGATSKNYPTETSNEKTIAALEKYKILSQKYESVSLSINRELQQSAQNEAVIEILQMQEILQNIPQSFLSQGSRKAIKNLQEELTAHKDTIHAISKNAGATSENYPTETSSEKTIAALEKYKILSQKYESVSLSINDEAVIEISQMQEILQNIQFSFLSKYYIESIKNLQKELKSYKEKTITTAKTSLVEKIAMLEKYKILSEQYKNVLLIVNRQTQNKIDCFTAQLQKIKPKIKNKDLQQSIFLLLAETKELKNSPLSAETQSKLKQLQDQYIEIEKQAQPIIHEQLAQMITKPSNVILKFMPLSLILSTKKTHNKIKIFNNAKYISISEFIQKQTKYSTILQTINIEMISSLYKTHQAIQSINTAQKIDIENTNDTSKEAKKAKEEFEKAKEAVEKAKEIKNKAKEAVEKAKETINKKYEITETATNTNKETAKIVNEATTIADLKDEISQIIQETSNALLELITITKDAQTETKNTIKKEKERAEEAKIAKKNVGEAINKLQKATEEKERAEEAEIVKEETSEATKKLQKTTEEAAETEKIAKKITAKIKKAIKKAKEGTSETKNEEKEAGKIAEEQIAAAEEACNKALTAYNNAAEAEEAKNTAINKSTTKEEKAKKETDDAILYIKQLIEETPESITEENITTMEQKCNQILQDNHFIIKKNLKLQQEHLESASKEYISKETIQKTKQNIYTIKTLIENPSIKLHELLFQQNEFQQTTKAIQQELSATLLPMSSSLKNTENFINPKNIALQKKTTSLQNAADTITNFLFLKIDHPTTQNINRQHTTYTNAEKLSQIYFTDYLDTIQQNLQQILDQTADIAHNETYEQFLIEIQNTRTYARSLLDVQKIKDIPITQFHEVSQRYTEICKKLKPETTQNFKIFPVKKHNPDYPAMLETLYTTIYETNNAIQTIENRKKDGIKSQQMQDSTSELINCTIKSHKQTIIDSLDQIKCIVNTINKNLQQIDKILQKETTETNQLMSSKQLTGATFISEESTDFIHTAAEKLKTFATKIITTAPATKATTNPEPTAPQKPEEISEEEMLINAEIIELKTNLSQEIVEKYIYQYEAILQKIKQEIYVKFNIEQMQEELLAKEQSFLSTDLRQTIHLHLQILLEIQNLNALRLIQEDFMQIIENHNGILKQIQQEANEHNAQLPLLSLIEASSAELSQQLTETINDKINEMLSNPNTASTPVEVLQKQQEECDKLIKLADEEKSPIKTITKKKHELLEKLYKYQNYKYLTYTKKMQLHNAILKAEEAAENKQEQIEQAEKSAEILIETIQYIEEYAQENIILEECQIKHVESQNKKYYVFQAMQIRDTMHHLIGRLSHTQEILTTITNATIELQIALDQAKVDEKYAKDNIANFRNIISEAQQAINHQKTDTIQETNKQSQLKRLSNLHTIFNNLFTPNESYHKKKKEEGIYLKHMQPLLTPEEKKEKSNLQKIQSNCEKILQINENHEEIQEVKLLAKQSESALRTNNASYNIGKKQELRTNYLTIYDKYIKIIQDPKIKPLITKIYPLPHNSQKSIQKITLKNIQTIYKGLQHLRKDYQSCIDQHRKRLSAKEIHLLTQCITELSLLLGSDILTEDTILSIEENHSKILTIIAKITTEIAAETTMQTTKDTAEEAINHTEQSSSIPPQQTILPLTTATLTKHEISQEAKYYTQDPIYKIILTRIGNLIIHIRERSEETQHIKQKITEYNLPEIEYNMHIINIIRLKDASQIAETASNFMINKQKQAPVEDTNYCNISFTDQTAIDAAKELKKNIKRQNEIYKSAQTEELIEPSEAKEKYNILKIYNNFDNIQKNIKKFSDYTQADMAIYTLLKCSVLNNESMLHMQYKETLAIYIAKQTMADNTENAITSEDIESTTKNLHDILICTIYAAVQQLIHYNYYIDTREAKQLLKIDPLDLLTILENEIQQQTTIQQPSTSIEDITHQRIQEPQLQQIT